MAKRIVVIKGLKKAKKKLKKIIADGTNVTRAGMIEAGLLLQRESQDAQRIPIDTGNLRASGFTAWGDGDASFIQTFSGDNATQAKIRHEVVVDAENGQIKTKPRLKPEVIVGFSAVYARRQHEGCNFDRSKGGGDCKWMEIAFVRNLDKMISLITDEFHNFGR